MTEETGPAPETAPDIVWRIHLRSSPDRVFAALATDEGRASFWCESGIEADGVIEFRFANGFEWSARILDSVPGRRYAVDYIDHSRSTFELTATADGGTDVVLTDSGVPARHHVEVTAGWVSVLLTLKAAVDHGIDLRNHDPARSWDDGYVDN